MAEARILYALYDMWGDEYTLLKAGEMWAADDPVVRKHPEWFTDDPTLWVRRTTPAPVVEAATANPGEVRHTGRQNRVS